MGVPEIGTKNWNSQPPEVGFEGEGVKVDGSNIIGSSRLLRGRSFKAQHSAEAKIAAMASFALFTLLLLLLLAEEMWAAVAEAD